MPPHPPPPTPSPPLPFPPIPPYFPPHPLAILHPPYVPPLTPPLAVIPGALASQDFMCRSITLAGGLLLLIWSENDKQRRNENVGLPQDAQGLRDL